MPGSVSILEHQIDSDVQTEYYDCSRKLKRKFNPEDVLKNRNVIFEDDQTLEDRKNMMVKLASIDSIEAYRTLEKCQDAMPDPLKDWAKLALQENRLLLESKLLNQNRILISTGLGGKGLKLRYFTVLMSLNEKFSSYQQKIIINELQYALKQHYGEIESILFDEELCTILSIIPLHVPVQKVFDDVISECNQCGSFVHKEYIITNVKVISTGDIRRMTRDKKISPEE